MTSGTITRDFRDASPHQAGTYYRKTWSGGDWPSLPKPEKPPLLGLDPRVQGKEAKRKLLKGIHENNRPLIEEYKRQIRSITQREVRRQRERRYEFHDYTWDILSYRNDYQEWFRAADLVCGIYPDEHIVGTFDSTFGGLAGNILGDFTTEDDYILASKLKSKILGSDFNLGVFIAESSEALGMIFNAANRLSRAITGVRRGNWRAVKRSLFPDSSGPNVTPFYKKGRTVAENWLALQYGWMPLISDLDAGARMLAHMTESPYSLRVPAQRQKIGNLKTASPSNTEAVGFCTKSKSIIAYLREVDLPQLVGLTNFASIAWERLPYSFVADWAIPIGNYLAARGIAQSLKGTFVTTSWQTMYCTNMLMVARKCGYIQVGHGAPYFYRSSSGVRTISTTLEVPKPSIKPFGEVLSWKRAANAVSLLIAQGTSAPSKPVPKRLLK
jgi:hypothetical protein